MTRASERLTLALGQAQILAKDLGHHDVTTAHLLVVMIKDPHCFATAVIEDYFGSSVSADELIDLMKCHLQENGSEPLIPVEDIIKSAGIVDEGSGTK